jgi:hypothetical protein
MRQQIREPQRKPDFPTKHIKLSSSSEKPGFAKHLQNCTVEKGNCASFECVVKGTPDTQIIWYRNGTPIQQSTDFMVNYDHQTGLSTLKIAQAFPEDSGQYTCIASNPGGQDSSTAWLVVRGKV